MTNSAVILMSGGLDSLVALAYVINKNFYDPMLALTFDYGQKSADKEIEASKNICNYYGVEHKIIKLDWLKEITKTALVSDKDVPNERFQTLDSAKSVWVPNRNALFLNIAGSFCDAFGFKYIIFGANKDEAQTFPDNTEEFRSKMTELFKTSTLVNPIVTAPLINYTKDDIVKIGAEISVPFELIWSCYLSGEKHCGNCESCNHLKKALITNHLDEYAEKLF